MIDPKKTYRTRDGREVRIYAVDGGENGAGIHGAIRWEWGWGHAVWYPHGGFLSGLGDPRDLIEVRPRIKREVWVNVYAEPLQAMSWLFLTRELADSAAASCREERIACVKLTIDCEEGEGL